MNPHLTIVREACIKAVPSIMELKFGCEGNYDRKPVRLLRYGMDFQNVDGPNVYVWQKEDGGRYVTPENTMVEILGRPIRLDDCREIVRPEYWLELIQIWVNGTLDDQPEKVVNFIYEKQN